MPNSSTVVSTSFCSGASHCSEYWLCSAVRVYGVGTTDVGAIGLRQAEVLHLALSDLDP